MKRGCPKHPKVSHLRELLKISLPTAIGYLELMWHFVAEFCPQGDIGKFSDARIEAALSWSGTKGRLIQALTDAGWLDIDSERRLLVHDWADHADGVVQKRLQRGNLEFYTVTPKVTGQRQPTADNGGLARAPSIPSPSSPSPIPGQAEPSPDRSSPASQKSAKSGEGACLTKPKAHFKPYIEELRGTLSLWTVAFPNGPDEVDLIRITTELDGTPLREFCAHLDAMKHCFQPGGKQEPETPGFFVSVARNFAKDYKAAVASVGMPDPKLTAAIEIPGRGRPQ